MISVALGLLVASTVASTGSASVEKWSDPITVARCPYAPPSLPEEAETALDATLIVKSSEGAGSAVLISPDGFALTAAHVVGDDEELTVIAHRGAEIAAHVVRVHVSQDVALLKLELDKPNSCLPLLEGDAALGSDVFILGSPAGEALSFSISKGIVSGYRAFDDVRFVQLDASVNPGNSGGPAVDADGSVVGIASWKLSHVSLEGLAFAVPVDVAVDALGILTGEKSSSDWKQRRGRFAPEEAAAVPAPSSVSPAAATDEPFDAAQIRRKRARKGLIVSGAITLGVGLPMLIAPAAVKAKGDPMTNRRWKTLLWVNTAGWVFSIAGTAMLVTGIALPKKVKGKKDGPSELSLAPYPGGMSFQGRF